MTSLLEIAEEIIQGVMGIYDYENELICFVNRNAEFSVIEHYYKGQFMGWNVYVRPEGEADLQLLETYDSELIANNVRESIIDGLTAGATFYRLPPNDDENEETAL